MMLNPNSDRLDYGEILAPPVDYRLDFAVGTTYSLDLDALVGVSLSLGLGAETDSELMKNPICLLEALRAVGDKTALFCEGGQIQKPNKVTPLYILLEQMVYPVKTAKRREIRNYPSFHPKFWLLKYVNAKKESLYRVVVLSRNLTFDRSWDVTFTMDGVRTTEENEKNQPVIDFLAYLRTHLPKSAGEKSRQIQRLMRELKNVRFRIYPRDYNKTKEFYGVDFIPMGIKTSNGVKSIHEYPLFQDSLHEILIMSPFLSSDVIRDFNQRSIWLKETKHVLITRMSALSRLKPADASNFKIYALKDVVVDGDSILEGESDETADLAKRDIHAKIYMTRKGSDSALYLGSANASHNALNGNVEFMIRLRSYRSRLNLDSLLTSLFDGEDGNPNDPFRRVELDGSTEMQEDSDHQLDAVIKDINRMNPSAVVSENESFYDVSIHFGEISCPYEISVQPLLSNRHQLIAPDMVFGKLTLMQLSEFYILTVRDGGHEVSRLLKIPTEGIPETRENEVITGIVNDESCFYRYVAFLLGDDMVLGALEAGAEESEGGAKGRQISMQRPALYEKMLKTAVSDPERFQEIDYLIRAISKDGVIPEGFEEMYNTFRKVVES